MLQVLDMLFLNQQCSWFSKDYCELASGNPLHCHQIYKSLPFADL
jgi:hypothetical protein